MASVINQIKLGTTEYAIAASAYAECDTHETTIGKAAIICTDGDTTNTAFTLVKGVAVQVKFIKANQSSSAITLDVNQTGGKAVYYRGAAFANGNAIKAGSIHTFVYDGTYWQLVGDLNTDTDTKNTAGSTDTDSKIFLVGATSQAANPQTYSHEEVYVDSNHVLTDTVGFKAGSDMFNTTYKANSISYIDGNNVKVGTLNLPTDEDGTFTLATKEHTIPNSTIDSEFFKSLY